MGFQMNWGNEDLQKNRQCQPITDVFTAPNGLKVSPIEKLEELFEAFKDFERIEFGFTGVVIQAKLRDIFSEVFKGERALASVEEDGQSFVFELNPIDGWVYPTQIFPKNKLASQEVATAVRQWAGAINSLAIDLNWTVEGDHFVKQQPAYETSLPTI